MNQYSFPLDIYVLMVWCYPIYSSIRDYIENTHRVSNIVRNVDKGSYGRKRDVI